MYACTYTYIHLNMTCKERMLKLTISGLQYGLRLTNLVTVIQYHSSDFEPCSLNQILLGMITPSRMRWTVHSARMEQTRDALALKVYGRKSWREWVRRSEITNSFRSRYGPVAGFYENGNGPWGFHITPGISWLLVISFSISILLHRIGQLLSLLWSKYSLDYSPCYDDYHLLPFFQQFANLIKWLLRRRG
jgi:hypothetical protein